MSAEVFRKIKGILCIAILAGAEVRQVEQNVRFNAGTDLNGLKSGIEAMMTESNLHEQAQAFAKQMEGVRLDVNWQEQAEQLAKQMEAMQADPAFREHGKLVSEQVEALLGKHPELQEQARAFAGMIEAIGDSPNAQEQAKVLVEKVKGMMNDPTLQEQANHVVKQMESMMHDPQTNHLVKQIETMVTEPKLEEQANRISEQTQAIISDPDLQERAKHLAKQVEEMMANPAVKEQTKRVADQIEAMTAEPTLQTLQDQTKALAEHIEAMTADENIQEYAKRIAEQVEAVMATPKLKEHTKLLAEHLDAMMAHLDLPDNTAGQSARPAEGSMDKLIDRVVSEKVDGLFDRVLPQVSRRPAAAGSNLDKAALGKASHGRPQASLPRDQQSSGIGDDHAEVLLEELSRRKVNAWSGHADLDETALGKLGLPFMGDKEYDGRKGALATALRQADHETLEKDLGRPKKFTVNDGKPCLQLFIATALSCISPLLFGYAMGFTSPAQGTMQGTEAAPNGLHVFSASTMTLYASLLNIGCVVGAFGGSYMSDTFGRKIGLAAAAIPQIIGWGGHSFAKSGTMLIILRVILGVGVGAGSAITPVYIGETATTSLRGALGACNQLSVTIGIFLANLLGSTAFQLPYHGETYHAWRGLSTIGAAAAAALAAGMLTPLAPETPSWLAKQGNNDGTFFSLKRLRAGPEKNQALEARELLKSAQNADTAEQSKTSSKGLTFMKYRRSTLIALGLLAFQQFSGINAIIMYTVEVCKQAGLTDPTLASSASMLWMVGITGVSCALMESAGRRGLLIFGNSLMTVAHLIMAYYFFASPLGIWAPSMMALGAIVIYLLGFSLGIGPIPWLIMPELIPTDARGSLAAVGTALNWASAFLVTGLFKTLEDTLTKGGTFLLFSVICAFSTLFTLALVPETKGKSVEEVMAILDKKVKGSKDKNSAR